MTKVRMSELVSFDVFDTCLVRSIAFPSDVFQELAQRLRRSLEPLLGSEVLEDFSAARIKAEERAIRATSLEEVTLDEIWGELGTMIPGLDEAKGKQAELDVEREFLRPNSKVLEAIREFREEGCRIVFASDTYLPADFIKDCLRKHGFALDRDVFYISSQLGITKRSGNLFKHLLAQERIPAGRVIHLGDNAHSDNEIPESLGIVTRNVLNTRLSLPERAILTGESIDRLTVSKVAGAMRVFRLRAATNEVTTARDFVSQFLGPLLLTFAAWTLAQARIDRVARLYFFSRDCYLLCKVAKIVADSLGDVDCRYLQVSRQALCLPSVVELSAAGIPWICNAWDQPSLDRLLAKLEIDRSEIGGNWSEFASGDPRKQRLKSTEDWNRFWAMINEEPVRTRLYSVIAERRRAALAYFALQGLRDEGVSWAVVDLGWWLTCQKALGDILRIERPGCDVRGYYLGLALGRKAAAEAGNARGLFYGSAPDKVAQVPSAEVFDRATVLEHVLGCAPHGTVRHYEFAGDVSYPVCRESCDSRKAVFAELEAACLEFCSENIKLAERLASPPIARHLINQLLISCLKNPRPDWARFLQSIEVSMDQNNLGSVPLASPYTWKKLVVSLLPVQLRYSWFADSGFSPWPEADLAMAPLLLAQCANQRNSLVRALKGVSRAFANEKRIS
jgi:FMN phosphatase YigB (HAD superfamily)